MDRSAMFFTLVGTGLALIAAGIVYIRWPSIFRRGLWMRTSIAIRTLSEDGYKRYMRGLGMVLVVLGVGVIIAACVREFA